MNVAAGEGNGGAGLQQEFPGVWGAGMLFDEGNGGEQAGVEGIEDGFAVESLVEGAGEGVVPEAADVQNHTNFGTRFTPNFGT